MICTLTTILCSLHSCEKCRDDSNINHTQEKPHEQPKPKWQRLHTPVDISPRNPVPFFMSVTVTAKYQIWDNKKWNLISKMHSKESSCLYCAMSQGLFHALFTLIQWILTTPQLPSVHRWGNEGTDSF